MKKTALISIVMLLTGMVAHAQCHAKFGYYIDSSNVFNFVDSSTGTKGAVNYTWYFGNGDSSTIQNPSYNYYFDTGYHRVLLKISDSLCMDTFSMLIHCIKESCEGDFTVVTDTNLGAAFTLHGYCSGGCSTYWNYGDSTSDSGLSMLPHHYKHAGTYKVCLRFVVGANTCVSKFCDSVTVYPIQNCHAYFKYSEDTSRTVRFYDASSRHSTHTSYYWDFGDSTSDVSKNPVHRFKLSGNYGICEYIYDSANSCSASYCDTFVVDTLIRCTPKFYYTLDSNLIVHFITYSAYGFYPQIVWDFGDSKTGVNSHTQHKYAKPGLYKVCLYVQECFATHCDTIRVINYAHSCTAKFSVDSTDTLKKLIYITNRSISADTTLWTFGDGDSSWSIHPTHTYASAGIYYICQRIKCGGRSSAFCLSISVPSVKSGGGYGIKVEAISTATTEAAVSHSLTVFPNPVTNNLTLMLPDNVSEGVLHIKNIIGQELRTQKLNAKLNTLDMGTLPAGMYMLQLQTPQGLFVTKVMKR